MEITTLSDLAGVLLPVCVGQLVVSILILFVLALVFGGLVCLFFIRKF